MTEKVFWEVISLLDWRKTGDDDAVLAPAIRALAKMSTTDIERFDDLLAERLFALDTREHARQMFEGEADVDNGDDYISADGFLYGRCVVVANGRDFFEAVLADPRKTPKGLEFESLLYLASMAFEKKTSHEYDHASPVDFESFSNKEGWAPTAKTRPGRFTGKNIPPGNRRPT
ncbi:MAG: DUF4240 domain-containing protein [Myxococcales bacterium]